MQAAKTSLANYDDKRMVILRPDASVYEAARALEANHIGCIVAADGERVVGIVTDRDLALGVIGYDLDARDLCLRDIMTPDVATLPATATEADAARLMRERHVRRIPIEDHGRVVGIVTFDDLVLAGFDPKGLSEIVSAQLTQAAPLKEKGDFHPAAPTRHRWNAPALDRHAAERQAAQHHAARAQASYESLIRRALETTKLETREAAETALEVLLAALIQRITPEEAADMLAQLPVLLRERLVGVTRGPNRAVNRESIEQVLSTELDLEPSEAGELVGALGRVVETALSSGELADMRAQLPEDLRSIFSRPSHADHSPPRTR